ncbi:MAG: 50S ribosomal protein L13 [Candidatus Neomarinimicrobiota bacterium]|nr:50S ribosomal protein L13 [Candidatus Neomarinimicrobiota bacterium]|tara:strand:+ start:187 stop:615 length:429 start_codon:yes stop_codon:yes gene_type:complete
MKTRSIKQSEINKKWWLVDAQGQTLGRFSSKIAQILRGKHKVDFTPHMDMGDFVIVINAEKVKLSGSKESDKVYFRHTGYPGGVKETKYSEMMQKFPERIVENAIKGMLPHNRLGRKILLNLKVYKGEEHPHLAQQPKPLKI